MSKCELCEDTGEVLTYSTERPWLDYSWRCICPLGEKAHPAMRVWDEKNSVNPNLPLPQFIIKSQKVRQ